jgi:hypothetical protein
MTDYEKTKKFLNDLGVEYEEDKYNFEVNSEPKDDEVRIVLRLVQGMKKVKGYTGFICEFMFDVSGNFIEVDIWK